MAWIESHQELRQHPKTKRLARALKVSVPAALGHLHLLWWWAIDYAPEGSLERFSAEDVADACMWEGDPAVFLGALVTSGFVDKDIMFIHDWRDFAGRLLDRREANKQRMRERRAAHVSDTTSARPGATEQNSTEPNSTEPKPKTGTKPSPSANGRESQEERTKIKNALVALSGWDPNLMTQRTWGRVEQAAKEAHDAGYSASDLQLATRLAQERYPGVDVTPQAIVGWLPSVPKWRAEPVVRRRR